MVKPSIFDILLLHITHVDVNNNGFVFFREVASTRINSGVSVCVICYPLDRWSCNWHELIAKKYPLECVGKRVQFESPPRSSEVLWFLYEQKYYEFFDGRRCQSKNAATDLSVGIVVCCTFAVILLFLFKFKLFFLLSVLSRTMRIKSTFFLLNCNPIWIMAFP